MKVELREAHAAANRAKTHFALTTRRVNIMKDYPVKPVPFTAVRFNDEFWAPRLSFNRREAILFVMSKNEETGRVGLFERAAGITLQPQRKKNSKRPLALCQELLALCSKSSAFYWLTAFNASRHRGQLGLS
jgi:hypothetical protein